MTVESSINKIFHALQKYYINKLFQISVTSSMVLIIWQRLLRFTIDFTGFTIDFTGSEYVG